MSTAAAYCQLTDFLFPGRVPLKKIKWNSRLEVDYINNWRILQGAWKEIGIDKVCLLFFLLLKNNAFNVFVSLFF